MKCQDSIYTGRSPCVEEKLNNDVKGKITVDKRLRYLHWKAKLNEYCETSFHSNFIPNVSSVIYLFTESD
jgi:hypothetical protein